MRMRGLLAAAALMSAALASPASAAADVAVHPGAEYTVHGTDTLAECTVGFMVVTTDPTYGFLTAGHCTEGDSVPVFGSGDAEQTEIGMSRVTRLIDPDHVGSVDISLVDISQHPWVSPSSGLPDGTPVRGVLPTSALQPGQLLCKWGITTGRTCGPVTSVVGDKVMFRAAADHGDSGGPVWAPRADGTAAAVAVLSGSLAASDDVAVGQLIGPWLSAWSLRLA